MLFYRLSERFFCLVNLCRLNHVTDLSHCFLDCCGSLERVCFDSKWRIIISRLIIPFSPLFTWLESSDDWAKWKSFTTSSISFLTISFHRLFQEDVGTKRSAQKAFLINMGTMPGENEKKFYALAVPQKQIMLLYSCHIDITISNTKIFLILVKDCWQQLILWVTHFPEGLLLVQRRIFLGKPPSFKYGDEKIMKDTGDLAGQFPWLLK